nr:M18 family aminopeptidase [Gammaproteobacteria bacterium]
MEVLNFIEFLKKSTNPFEAVRSLKEMLDLNNFTELKEEELWKLEKGEKYYVERNGSSIIAFTIPSLLDDLSFNVCASHTDSPTFKIKPKHIINKLDRYVMLNTEVYGGAIINSFFDKPLSISGRIMVKKNNGIEEKLINFDRDLVVIPNECIHFNRNVNSGKEYNPQIELPLLGYKKDLYSLIEEEYGIKEKDILSFDLFLYSRFRGSIIGSDKCFFVAPQIDNLESAYSTFKGFIESQNDKSINVCASFNNEEVGSASRDGAKSTFLKDTLERIALSLNLSQEALKVALANSFIVSCDNAHAVHPNDIAKTDELNKCFMNEGIIIKHNSSLSYTTDALSEAIFKFILEKHNIPYQDFTNRSDIRGGSTLGCLSLSQVSIPSVDIGL